MKPELSGICLARTWPDVYDSYDSNKLAMRLVSANAFSDGCTATRNEMIDNRNDCQHQEDVNEARRDMESKKSTEPHQQEHKSDDSKHFSSS
jgi:hypothetical protein